MNQQKKSLALLVLAIGAFGILCRALYRPPQDMLVHVYMLDVGQGDSFLVQTPEGRQMLIDGGKDAAVLGELARVMPKGDRSIDVVLATHPDADHIGGLALVLERYSVSMFLTTQVTADTQLAKDLFALLAKQHIPAYYARQGMVLTLEHAPAIPVTFRVVFPDRNTSTWETNSASIVGILSVGKRSALFTGDSPASVEAFLVKAIPKDIDVDILKLGHHGSKTSSSELFLKTTTPALALISAGFNNRYGHPAPEVTDRLTAQHIPWLNTAEKGTVTLSSDGEKWVVEK